MQFLSIAAFKEVCLEATALMVQT